jgi:hypothetical protein
VTEYGVVSQLPTNPRVGDSGVLLDGSRWVALWDGARDCVYWVEMKDAPKPPVAPNGFVADFYPEVTGIDDEYSEDLAQKMVILLADNASLATNYKAKLLVELLENEEWRPVVEQEDQVVKLTRELAELKRITKGLYKELGRLNEEYGLEPSV